MVKRSTLKDKIIEYKNILSVIAGIVLLLTPLYTVGKNIYTKVQYYSVMTEINQAYFRGGTFLVGKGEVYIHEKKYIAEVRFQKIYTPDGRFTDVLGTYTKENWVFILNGSIEMYATWWNETRLGWIFFDATKGDTEIKNFKFVEDNLLKR